METENNKTIELKLSQSEFSDAMVCNDQNLIHKVQMNQILEIVDAQFQKAKNYTPSTTPEDRKIVHNTISIFANRGAGKTTFLLSALKRIRDNYKKMLFAYVPSILPSLTASNILLSTSLPLFIRQWKSLSKRTPGKSLL